MARPGDSSTIASRSAPAVLAATTAPVPPAPGQPRVRESEARRVELGDQDWAAPRSEREAGWNAIRRPEPAFFTCAPACRRGRPCPPRLHLIATLRSPPAARRRPLSARGKPPSARRSPLSAPRPAPIAAPSLPPTEPCLPPSAPTPPGYAPGWCRWPPGLVQRRR